MNFSSNLRLFFTYFFVVILVTSGVMTVFGTDLVFQAKIKNIQVLGKNIFLDDKNLRSTHIIYTSSSDLSEYKLISPCSVHSKFVGKLNDKYFFKIKYLRECNYGLIQLKSPNSEILKDSTFVLKIFDRSKLFDFFVDRNNLSLSNIKSNIENNIEKLDSQFTKSQILNLKIQRRILELDYQKNFLNDIFISRSKKYLVPVEGYTLPIKKSKIPNTGRPYRSDYTDGIHHSWDIDTPFGEEAIALDYGKIIRIVNDWEWSDFSNLKYENLSYEDKIDNLDILRGNQVWLKTSKGDVVFYSHLDDVYNLKEGELVDRGQKLGTIGVSGIPDKKYTDYHLDFSIQKNPYTNNKVGKYTFMDYMKWDWYFKGQTLEYVLENQNKVFE